MRAPQSVEGPDDSLGGFLVHGGNQGNQQAFHPPEYTAAANTVGPYRTTRQDMPDFMSGGPRGPPGIRGGSWQGQHQQHQQFPFQHHQHHQHQQQQMQQPDPSEMFEVHDNHFKAPISLRAADILHTSGSFRLLIQGHGPSSNRNFSRICEMFQHGQCPLGEECPDIHVMPELLSSIRDQMTSWLRTRELEFGESMLRDPNTTFRVFCADLKEVVEVPISALAFTRGLYVDPSARAKRSRVGQPSNFAQIASQVPTACGLYSVDPAQCKWGCWCNQAHINPEWLAMKRIEFGEWSMSLEQRFMELPPSHSFYVHDPQTKTSMQIPKMAIAEFSRGLFQGSAKKAPSICMLFQRGRCTAHGCCNQIHVFPDFLAAQRQYLMEGGGGAPPTRAMPPGYGAFEEDLRMRQAGPMGGFNPNAMPFVPGGAPQDQQMVVILSEGGQEALLLQTSQLQLHQLTNLQLPPPQLSAQQHALSEPQTPPTLGPQSPQQLPSPLRAMMEPRAQNQTHVSPLADLLTDGDEVYAGSSAPRQPATQTTPMKQNNPYSSAGLYKAVGVPPSPSASASTPTMPPSTPPMGTPPMQFSFMQPYRMPPAMSQALPPPSPQNQSRQRQTTPSSPGFVSQVDLSNMQFSPSPLMKAGYNDSLTAMPRDLTLEDHLGASLTRGAPLPRVSGGTT